MTAGRVLVFGATAAAAAGCALTFSPPPTQSEGGAMDTGTPSKDGARDHQVTSGDARTDSRTDASTMDGARKDAESGDGARDGFVADHASSHEASMHADAGPAPYWWMSDTFDTNLGLSLWDGTPAVDPGLATLAIVDGGVVPHSGCCTLQTTAMVGSPSYATISRVWVTSGRPMAPPVTSGTIAIRAFVQTVALAMDTREIAVGAPPGPTLWYLTTGMGGSPPSWSSFLVNPANPGGVGSGGTVGAAVFDQKWHCTEVQMDVSSDAGAVAIFVDGLPQGLPYNGNTSPPDGGWVAGTVGIGHSSGETPVNVFFDDVVIALYTETSSPPRPYIGCGAWPASTQ